MQRAHVERSFSEPLGGSPKRAEGRGLSGDIRAGASKPRALVVDDSPDVTEIFALLLRKEGYDVVRVYSAAEALEAARRERFDLVVSDIGMPVMNGYQLAEELRALQGYEGVPMMAVTGFSRYDDAERSRRAGFDAHLTKPVEPTVLSTAVRRLRNGA